MGERKHATETYSYYLLLLFTISFRTRQIDGFFKVKGWFLSPTYTLELFYQWPGDNVCM